MSHKTIHFTKMHGLGNDYIYVNTDECAIADPEAFSIQWSKPHTGIGSDGLVLISRSSVADFRMRIFNADGSEAMMCGNASRCIGKYVYEKGLTQKTDITLETLSGIKYLTLSLADNHVDKVTVDMGEPLLANPKQVATPDGSIPHNWLPLGNAALAAEGVQYVCMGNPHLVIFVKDITATDIASLGKALEFDALFPERINVEFAQILSDGSIRMRVWERGSGITQACGTGACATAVAAFTLGKASHTSIIRMDGGDLEISLTPSNHVLMKGDATFAFEGEVKE